MAKTTQGLPGLTFEGALGPNPGIAGRLDRLRDTGVSPYDNEPEYRFRQTMKDVDDEEELLGQMLSWTPTRNQRMQSQRNAFLNSSVDENYGLEMAEAGYGQSRFDENITNPAQLTDIEDTRSKYQSGFGVIANSIAKMGVLAGTTAADSFVGIPAGLINMATELASGHIKSGRDALNAVIENPVSVYLQEISNRSDEIFQNFRSAEERNRPWWENIFTANFIGDTLIKNAGFTIGAVLGGKATVGILGEISGAKEARDAFKGLTAELGLSGKTASEALKMIADGTTKIRQKAAIKALEESARKLKNAELGLRIAGSVVAGTGEARIEAIHGADELDKAYTQLYGDIDMSRANALRRVKEDMARAGIDINSPEGQKYYNDQKEDVDENYRLLQEQIAHDKAIVANTIFALNVPLLTFGDAVQWGKLMLGGYNIDRSLVKGITTIAKADAKSAAAGSVKDLVAGMQFAEKGTKFTRALEKGAAASRNVFIEMQEEMNQSFFSETAKARAMGTTTEFMERLYDPMAVHDTVTWLDAVKEGFRQSWLNKDDWVEGFAGGFMGFMGLPSISVKVNDKGQQVPKITMEGGIWSPLREKNDLFKRRNELVTTLNNRLKDPEFLNYYYGRIGNKHFDSIKEEAIQNADEGLYKKADHAQLINDAIMFEKAGRLQDFIDIVDSFQNVSDEDLARIRDLFPDSAGVKSMTDEKLKKTVKENATRMKEQLDDYLQIADNLRVTYGTTVSDAFIAEMTWQTAHLNEIEKDLSSILKKPVVTKFLSDYRAKAGDKVKELTDYEVVSSGGFISWLVDKYNDNKDTASKKDLEEAIKAASDADYDMKERLTYINNLSLLSTDPELVEKNAIKAQTQQARARRLQKLSNAINVMSTATKLSDFINAMEDVEGEVDEEILAGIQKEAENGNVVADEYLKIRDMDSSMDEAITRAGEKVRASASVIKQAKDAWNYIKRNSDTAYDVIKPHTADDVASDIAGGEAIGILNEAISSVAKNRKLYDSIRKRSTKDETGEQPGRSGGEAKEFSPKLTGKTLTKKRFDEIVDDLKKDKPGNMKFILRMDMEKSSLYFDGKEASGTIYVYYPEASGNNLPVIFDEDGNEIAPEDAKKITGPDRQTLYSWYSNPNFPVAGARLFPLMTDKLIQKAEAALPVGKGKQPKSSDDSKGKEGKGAGSKTEPHKFIAPSTDLSLLGGDGHAVAELIKSLQNDSELHFGMESADGPIYILAGEENMKIGTLPKQGDGSDVYMGLSALEALIRKEFAESGGTKSANGMWVSEKYINHLREKRTTGFETTEKNIPINDIPGFDGIKSPALMFVYDAENEQKQVFSDDSISLEDVQLRAAIGAKDLKSGFAYLLVPYGEKYIPVMLYTQNVNSETLDLHDPAVTAQGFGKRLNDTLDKIVESLSITDKSDKIKKFEFWTYAKADSSSDSLQKLLYMNEAGKSRVEFYIREKAPKEHEAWFSNDDVVMVINRHDLDTKEDIYEPIFRNDKKSIKDQIIDVLYNMEFHTERGETHKGPIAQVHQAQFDGTEGAKTRMRELVDARMFLTDVKGFDLSMPSYIMDYWSEKQGKFVRPSYSDPVASSKKGKVTVKKLKTGTEIIVDMTLRGSKIQYNLTTGMIKYEGGKSWFSPMSATKLNEAQVKKLGFKDMRTFARTAKAMALVISKYGDKKDGEGRIGNRVLLKGFAGKKDEGFVVTDDGGRFMSADELLEFKKELSNKKAQDKKKRDAEERKRIKEVQSENEVDDNEDEFEDQQADDVVVPREQVASMEKIKNVEDALNLLMQKAPEYRPLVSYLSGIGFYNELLVELADIVDPNNTSTKGRNVLSYRGKEFTDRIIIGRNSLGYQTLMHELVHAFTAVALRHDNVLYDEVNTMMDYLQDKVGNTKLVEALGANGMYAFTSPYEFVAEFFSNQKLQELAKGISLQEEEDNSGKNIFARIVNFIAKAFKSLFKKKDNSLFDKINSTLYSIIDRQAELQATGELVFKTQEEFNASRPLAQGASVNGVAFASKIQTVEDSLDYIYLDDISEDRSSGIPELRSYDSEISHPSVELLELNQLLQPSDVYSSHGGMQRLLSDPDVYVYDNNSGSYLIGQKVGEVFVTVRSLSVVSGGSYASLIKNVVNSQMPIILGASEDSAKYYTDLGMTVVGNSDGKVFVANKSFTEEDLYRLGTTYRVFADVLDSNSSFNELRKSQYSDEEWEKFSEAEKYHARKCIGI